MKENGYGVPDLELDLLVVDLEVPGAEFHADGRIMLIPETRVRELK